MSSGNGVAMRGRSGVRDRSSEDFRNVSVLRCPMVCRVQTKCTSRVKESPKGSETRQGVSCPLRGASELPEVIRYANEEKPRKKLDEENHSVFDPFSSTPLA